MRIYIIHGKRIISQTKDLRKLIWYASKFKVKDVTVTRLIPRDTAPMDATARLQISFANGAICGTDFASFQACVSFVKARIKNWRGDRKPVFYIKTNEREGLGQRNEYEDHIFIVEP